MSATHVPAAFTVTTSFTDAESAVSSCEYTLNGSTWSAGVVSGTGPYTCTANVTGQTNGTALTINMRATSSGGTGTATAISRTVDAAKPTVSISVGGSTSGSPVAFTVTFNEAVSGFAASDVTLGGTAGATTKVVSGGPSIYTVDVSGMTVTGTITMDIAAGIAGDAVGNTNTAATQASTNWSSCVETVTGVTVNEPITNPIEIATAIGATKSGTGGGTPQVRWTVDGGTPSAWQNSGATFTPTGNKTGSVVFEAQVAGFCAGNIFTDPTPVTVAYDSRLPGLTTQTASGTQASTTSITVTMPYLGDKDGDATFQVNYKLSSSGTWTTGTPVNPSPEVNPYTVTLTGLTADSTYNIQVIYVDPDSVTGTATQTFNVTLISWVDSALLHNSNRFACSVAGFYSNKAECEGAGGTWELARKWPGTAGVGNEWGTSGADDQYGPINCATCHERNADPNIKRIKGTITASRNTFPGQSETVSATNASSSYGADNTAHATSTRVCEVCHSQNSVHNYTMAAAVPHNGNDCISCHQHKVGFRASCNACHGSPPIVNTVGSPGLVNNPGITNSTTAGKHVRHVTDPAGPKYTCDKCHGSPFGSGPNHIMSKVVTISFNAFGTTGASVAGTYKGQIGVLYDGNNDGAPDNSLTCAATYCHGGTIGGTTPTWTGTAACGSCHGATAGTPPASPASSLSHQTHAGTGGKVDAQNSLTLTGTVMACSACHGANGAGPASHLDGKTQFDVTALASDYRNPAITVKYKTLASGDSGALAKVNPYSTCSNSACHWNTVTPAWNAGPATCTTCHNNGNNSGLLVDSAPASGKHADHVDASATYVTCNNCHGTGATTGTHVGHINGSVNFYGTVNATDNNLDATDFSGEATRGDTRDDTCAVVCHKDGDWGDGSVASTATVPANKGTLDWTVDCSSVPVVDACTDCHSGTYSGKAGPTVIKNWATTPTGSHLKAATADTLPGNACADVTTWKNQCNKCHTKHSGTVQIPLPPTSWDNPGTAVVETTNMRTQLGISYVGADHGAIKLGGTATSGSTEADLCWSCHGTLETINEWAYNQDTNGATFPTTIIPDRNAASSGSHNYGYIYTTSARTTKASAWVNASGVGNWHQDGYSTLARLQRQITSVHSGNFTPANQVSSVGTAVNATTGVITATAQETPANIRCSYCHDLHDLNLAASDTNTGRPYLRGTWMGNPYAPDLPPVAGDTYPNSGAGANAYMFTSTGNYAGKPRLFSTSTQKGGYFLDANSGRPTTNASYDTLAKTAGVCTLCHGTDVDNMDFYPNSNAATKMWRSDQVNGHANSTLGGSGASHANARKLFDARRGTATYPATLPVYMGAQDALWLRVTSLNPGFNYGKASYSPNATFTAGTVEGQAVPTGSNAVPPQGRAPHSTWTPSQPGNSGHAGMTNLPMRITGWYGGTAKGNVTDNNQSTLPSEFFKWYSSTGIGTDGSGSGRAHSFTCSKCHTPHASGLPALLITNCLDTKVSTWGTTAYGPNATGTFGLRAAVTCHRNEGTTTGWHKLAVNQ